MADKRAFIIWTLICRLPLLISLYTVWPQAAQAIDKELKSEEIVANHLKSIGSPEVLAGIKNRGIGGVVDVDFVQGGYGKLHGDFMLVSAGQMLAMVMKFGALEYPGEHFAYDGREVTVENISPGQRSPLADFLYRYNGLMKEGLVGGTLSVGWSLLDLRQRKTKLKSDKKKIEGRQLHELKYDSDSGLNRVEVKLYFDSKTFHHVRTEYRLRVRGDMSFQSEMVVPKDGIAGAGVESMRGASEDETRPAGIHDAAADSIYRLVERFENFKEVDGITLPHSYHLEYSVQGRGSSFVANYTVTVKQIIQNGKVDASFFRVQ